MTVGDGHVGNINVGVLPVPHHGPGNLLQPYVDPELEQWIATDNVISDRAVTAHIRWRDAVFTAGKLTFKDGVFGGHIPKPLATHLWKNGKARKELITTCTVFFNKDGSVSERLPDGTMGMIIVPPK